MDFFLKVQIIDLLNLAYEAQKHYEFNNYKPFLDFKIESRGFITVEQYSNDDKDCPLVLKIFQLQRK